MGEGGGGEEKGRPDTKPFSKLCDTSRIWMWQRLDNTQSPWHHRPQANTSRAFKFHVVILRIETKRGIQKGSRGRSQVLSGNKNKTRARIVFSKPCSSKERCSRSMEKPHIPASAETMSEYWFHKNRTKKTISVLQISKFCFTTSCR